MIKYPCIYRTSFPMLWTQLHSRFVVNFPLRSKFPWPFLTVLLTRVTTLRSRTISSSFEFKETSCDHLFHNDGPLSIGCPGEVRSPQTILYTLAPQVAWITERAKSPGLLLKIALPLTKWCPNINLRFDPGFSRSLLMGDRNNDFVWTTYLRMWGVPSWESFNPNPHGYGI
jgi:hypothetical protein